MGIGCGSLPGVMSMVSFVGLQAGVLQLKDGMGKMGEPTSVLPGEELGGQVVPVAAVDGKGDLIVFCGVSGGDASIALKVSDVESPWKVSDVESPWKVVESSDCEEAVAFSDGNE